MASALRPRRARLDELSELLEFQPRPARRHPRDKPPTIAVEKPEVQHVILKPVPGRRQPHGRSPAPLALGEQLLCHDRCVALDFRFVLRKRADRVVQQVSTQTAGLSFETQGRMDHSGKAGSVFSGRACAENPDTIASDGSTHRRYQVRRAIS